jgi:heparan-alpha-glucosaminide N-acetyltransferase
MTGQLETRQPVDAAANVGPPAGIKQRYLALDAFRGFIMLVLVSAGFGLLEAPVGTAFRALARWFDHVPWEGGVFWDMIQPAFMFMVGVAMPFALMRRLERGDGFRRTCAHVAARSLRLFLLSEIIMCIHRNRVHLQFTNVLAQIALTYFLCFLIMQLRLRWQLLTAAVLLFGHWALFAAFPGPEGAFSKDGNLGDVLDQALLGWKNQGHYGSLNFICSTVTTLFGVWTGMLFRAPLPDKARVRILAAMAAGAFGGAWILAGLGNPIVKRLWTASWTLYSAGWVVLMMLAFYVAIEVLGLRRWTFPLVVLGMNSVFIYTIDELLRPWLNKSLAVFTGGYRFLSSAASVAQSCSVLLLMWLLCWWLYRRGVFLKL